jgi:hypothetical protein
MYVILIVFITLKNTSYIVVGLYGIEMSLSLIKSLLRCSNGQSKFVKRRSAWPSRHNRYFNETSTLNAKRILAFTLILSVSKVGRKHYSSARASVILFRLLEWKGSGTDDEKYRFH